MITTGKKIYSILSQSAGVTDLVSSRIYPLVLPENTSLPAIVYERSFTNVYTKDYRAGSESVINITILAREYSDTIAISEAVEAALGNYSDTSIRLIKLENGAETYLEGAFVQNLTYTVRSV